MKAIILCAGNSTRYGKNKLLAKFNDKTLPEYNIDFCIENGITDICVTVSRNQCDITYYGEIGNDVVSNLVSYVEKFSAEKINLSFKFQDTDKYGPGAGLLPWLPDNQEDVLVLFGDNFVKGKFDKSLLKEFDAVATYKELEKDSTNERFGAIDGNKLIEKPHLYREGKFFIGFAYFTPDGFRKLNDLSPSVKRKEYEITEFFNSIEKRTITPVVEHWIDLTYQSDDTDVSSAIAKASNI
ncbi:MAG: NTP transferase domain-containing protein [Candidatus Pacearchaeota archaeon]|jgi:dTDP-glucose pyrophosphorylase|nr:NTP transferase domain-containing protein [Clostridia bacterium]